MCVYVRPGMSENTLDSQHYIPPPPSPVRPICCSLFIQQSALRVHEVTRVRYKLAIAGTAILLVEKHHTKAYVYLWFIYVLICLVTILPVLFFTSTSGCICFSDFSTRTVQRSVKKRLCSRSPIGPRVPVQ